jgi:TonB family protein
MVSADGTVNGVKVTKSSDSDRLDSAAIHCVRQWHYRPAIKDNQTIDAPMTVKVDWNLEDNTDKSDGEGEKKDGKAIGG